MIYNQNKLQTNIEKKNNYRIKTKYNIIKIRIIVLFFFHLVYF